MDLLIDDNREMHTEEMKKVIRNYANAVDFELYHSIKDVMEGREILPLTVGYFSEITCEYIQNELDSPRKILFAPRVIIDADTIRHIVNRHGSRGKADHSMSDINDFARLPYVLANYDAIEFDGNYSKKFKCKDGSPAPHLCFSKKIDGTYYVITAVSDAKTNKSYIVSAYIG